MDVIEQIDVILPDLAELCAQVGPDDFDRPTPCANFKVRDLFDHLIGGASQFAPQLTGQPAGPLPQGLSDAERPAAVKAAISDLQEAVKAPGAFQRSVNLPFGTVPGEVLVRFLTVDGMVHCTDMARATGQRYEPDEALAAEVLASAQALIAPEMRDGDTFADEVPVPDDAPAVTRLIAFTGRSI